MLYGNVTGVVSYIHPEDAISEKFQSVEFGLDCSQEINGRIIPEFIGVQAARSGKMDRIKLLDGIKKGDTVKCNIACGSYQVNANAKKGNREVIYNNVNLIKLELVSRAQVVAPAPIDPNTVAPPADSWKTAAPGSNGEAIDDLPF